MVLVKGSAQQHVPMDVRVSVKVAKVVARMDAKQHVVVGAGKDVKAVATQCAKATV